MLTGPAGTGKTAVALQVANNLVQELEDNAEPGKEPVLVVTVSYMKKEHPLLKHLETQTSSAKTKIFNTWEEIKKEYSIVASDKNLDILKICESFSKK